MAFLKLLTLLTVALVVSSKQDFSKRVTNFSFELLYFTALETDSHTVISPYGIWTLMAAVAQGTDGRSYDQLTRALNLPKRTSRTELANGCKVLSTQVRIRSRGVTLRDSNFMFTDQNFQVNREFKQILWSTFNTAVYPLDFGRPRESVRSANEEIAKATNGQITDALRADDFDDAQVILTNVIHFKGLWKLPFNVTDTKIEPFFDEDGVQIGRVNMMSQRATLPFTNMKKLGAYVLEVPYGEDDKFSMLVMLPYPGVRLLDMFRKFQTVSLNEIFASIDKDRDDFGEEEVDFSLPRFKISTNLVLNKPLNSMGVFDIFDPSMANFNQLTKDPVFVSKVVHKAEIEVTESGTVASAVTSSIISNRNPPVDYRVNRPFMYLIMERTSPTVIFGGMYSKPSVFI